MQNLVPTKFCSNREQKTNNNKKKHNITKTDNKTTIKSFLTKMKFCCANFIFISENTIFFQVARFTIGLNATMKKSNFTSTGLCAENNTF